MKDSQTLLTLPEFVAELAQQFKALGLESLPDRRASGKAEARTIRYYTSLGLLEPPVIQARRAHYHQGHQEQVLLIKLLQARGYGLQQIQREYYGLSAQERHALLESLKLDSQKTESTPAPALTALHWREYPLLPGLRLQVAADFQSLNREQTEACLQKIKAILEQSEGKKDDQLD